MTIEDKMREVADKFGSFTLHIEGKACNCDACCPQMDIRVCEVCLFLKPFVRRTTVGGRPVAACRGCAFVVEHCSSPMVRTRGAALYTRPPHVI